MEDCNVTNPLILLKAAKNDVYKSDVMGDRFAQGWLWETMQYPIPY